MKVLISREIVNSKIWVELILFWAAKVSHDFWIILALYSMRRESVLRLKFFFASLLCPKIYVDLIKSFSIKRSFLIFD